MSSKAFVGGEGAVIHTGDHIKLRKCTYTGHCAAIWSVENAIQVLDQIGFLTDSDDCLPFAIRLVENGELIQIAEDNGEFGCGDVLADCLSKLDKYNVLVCVSRKISDSFVLDMFQRQVLNSVREAGNSAVDRIHAHFVGIENKKRVQQPEFDDDIAISPLNKKGSPSRLALPMQRVSLDSAAVLSNSTPSGREAVMSNTRKKLRDSIHRSKAIGNF